MYSESMKIVLLLSLYLHMLAETTSEPGTTLEHQASLPVTTTPYTTYEPANTSLSYQKMSIDPGKITDWLLSY